MKVILKEDIKGVGKKDEVINASDGYARNFLFPKNKAVEANAENMSKLKAKQDSNNYKKEQEKEEAKRVADKISKISKGRRKWKDIWWSFHKRNFRVTRKKLSDKS